MPTPSVRGRPNASPSGRAFTLVELVTAASIMTIIMIGVVEIFAVVTQTAAEAEAIHGAYQQMRATLDRLNRDLRGITPEGYIRIDANETPGIRGETAPYATYSLTFVSVGRYSGIFNDPQAPPLRAGAAEILYTTNVDTPPDLNNTADYFLKIKVGGKDQVLDHRRGILARSAWLMDGQSDDNAAEDKDGAKASYLGELYASLDGTSPRWVGRTSTKVVPFLPSGTAPPDLSVRRVMTTCTSEFKVEYLDGSGWKLPAPGEPKIFHPGDSDWPRAIRVTLTVHDPDDRGPLPDDGRFKRYALQETFWIGAR